jgi:death-on-curing protein
VKYLTAQDMLVLHALVIDETGGMHGIRDTGLLHSASERPKARFGSKELYPNSYVKAAAYFESLIKNHVFFDGNKRIAVLATARFLFLNGFELKASNKEMEDFALNVIHKKLDVKDIAIWLKHHTRRLQNS